MSDLISDYTRAQPMPRGSGEPVVPKLIELIEARRRKGIATYGTELKTDNGRNSPQDLVEELVDAAVYGMQWLTEREELLNKISRQGREIARLKRIIAGGK